MLEKESAARMEEWRISRKKMASKMHYGNSQCIMGQVLGFTKRLALVFVQKLTLWCYKLYSGNCIYFTNVEEIAPT